MRKEDYRLVTGAGAFTDDTPAEGALWAAFVRSPHAHAGIRGIDKTAAMAVAGARLVLTGADWQAAGFGPIPIQRRLVDAEGKPPRDAPWPVLAHDVARHVGVPVAMCVGDTREAAEAMALAVAVDYAPLTAVTAIADALADGAPQIWPSAPGNVAFRWTLGDRSAVDAAFAEAAHVVEARRTSQRVVICPMEPRAAVAQYDTATGTFQLHSGNQGMTIMRDQIASALGVDKHSIVVTSRDVGGAFGIRNGTYPEYPALLHAARLLGAPVRWTATRSEAFVSDAQARDSIMHGRLALDGHGRILALDVTATAAVGAYMHHVGYFIATANFSRCLPGPYRIPAVHSEVTLALTNTVPTAPYRGAGRPEAAYIMESLIEAAAEKLGLDPVEIRRRNLIGPEAMPHRTAVGMTYCSGDFPDLLDRALAAADWSGLPARKAEARTRGRYRGAGIGIFVEISGGVPNERAKMQLATDGRVHVRTAIGASGQGHETIFAMLADEQLGLGIDRIVVAQGDSTGFEDGGSSSASRSTTMAGLAIRATALDLIEAAKKRAAERLGVAADSVQYEAGRLSVPATNLAIGLEELATGGAPPIDVEARIEAEPTWPSGCHIAEVEVDPATGVVEVVQFVAVDDCGRVIHHELSEGQVHGALAQGFGQVLMEHGHYDPGSGQLVAGSMMDYALPRARDLPHFTSILAASPARSNALGVKGVGESGTVGPLPALMNAIRDALKPIGAIELEMPATPPRVWAAIERARKG
ncbi:MAG: xanthine dehydrogenase family protein molybdopterin-binding subunit [Hyphomicrobiaceae bacterium]|nr:xanthine dehydrogenase family protein molybdopterin-binding subunit [Hyphomicrobiaceae bacterium]